MGESLPGVLWDRPTAIDHGSPAEMMLTPHAAERDADAVVALERALLDIAVALINVDVDDLDAVVDDTLARVGRSRGADRVSLARYDWDAGTLSATNEWCAPGVASMAAARTALPIAAFPEQVAVHRSGEVLLIPDLSELGSGVHAAVVESARGVGSMISVPLMDGPECLGFVALDAVDRVHRWTRDDERLLGILATLLVNVERRRRAEAAHRAIHELTASNEALSRFAGEISHDLRTPLTSLRGFLELVLSRRVPEEVAETLLVRALANADRLSQMVEHLLSDALGGRDPHERVCLEDVVDEAVELLAGPIALRDARIEVEPLPCVTGSRGQLVRLVQNLVANALVHVPEERTPAVSITAATRRSVVELRVADNGTGIAPDDRASALRDRGRLAEDVDGAGLGLAICQRIAAAHGGRLRLDTASSGGLLVSVQLPAFSTA